MRSSRSLNRYLALIFLKHVVGVFFATFCLMLLVDILELARQSGDADVSFVVLAAISMTRMPALTESLVPFAVLIAALTTLVSLSRRSELVVARASGVSAWQFLLPLVGVAAGVGLATTLIYNPGSATLKNVSDALLSEHFGASINTVDPEREVWFRQSMGETVALLRAASTTDDGTVLNQVSALMFDATGDFSQRIDASQADLRDGSWHMNNATMTSRTGESRQIEAFALATPLTADDVLGRFTPPSAVPIWHLPTFAEKAQQAGISADRYQFQFQALLARPMLLMAMVLVAATVSLRFSRHGGTTKLVIAGLSAGFVVFVVNEFAGDIGGAGLINPIFAAWLPPIAAGLFGITALLHLEDG